MGTSGSLTEPANTHININNTNRDFRDTSVGKESACNAGDPGLMPGLGRSLERRMATHSSILAWRTPWTEERGGL